MAILTSSLATHHSLLASALGVLSHRCIFVKGEWHLHSPHLVGLTIAAPLTVFILDICVRSAAVSLAATHAVHLTWAFALGLFMSMLVYRSFYHRLSNFDGPWLAKYSKLWHVWHCLNSQNHYFLHDIHKKYGTFVRTGPSELTIFHPNIHQITDGTGNTCFKSDWYDMMTPELSVVSVRDKKVHDDRRKIWARGFDTPSLKYYDDRVMIYVEQLQNLIDKAIDRNEALALNKIFYWFGWDVMADVIFGKPFRMLQDEKYHGTILQLKRAMSLLGPISPVPWLAHIAFAYIPGIWVVKDWFDTIEMCRQKMMERIKLDNNAPDVSTQMVQDAYDNGMTTVDKHWLVGDSVLAVMAGSDTVTFTLVSLFYRLANHPEIQERLYQEVKNVDVKDIEALSPLTYLNSCIRETLRLHPALPSGGARATGPEGIMVDGTYIPGNTTIIAPKYTIHRLESCFEQAEDFIPERWTTRPEMVKDRRGFNPFGLRRYSCAGRNLALSELRFVISSLVQRYHVNFAPGEDGHRFAAEMKDWFTPSAGPVDISFSWRET